jgi:hypothetical protein
MPSKYDRARALMPRALPAAAYDQRPVPVDPSLLAALAWRKARMERIAAAKVARPVPAAAALLGSRYQGGSSAAARSR